MSSNDFIIQDKSVSRCDWHEKNIENLIRLFYIFENKIKEYFPKYIIKDPVNIDKFNKFSILIFKHSSGN